MVPGTMVGIEFVVMDDGIGVVCSYRFDVDMEQMEMVDVAEK